MSVSVADRELGIYKRKIVDASPGDNNLEVEGCLQSLKMALKKIPPGQFPIHHSDRGSHAYVNHVQRFNLRIRMTEVNHIATKKQKQRESVGL